MRTVSRWLSFFIALLLPLAASGQGKGKPFVFAPQWTAQAQFAGYYAALEKGFYEEEGLNVEIVHPFATQDLRERVLTAEADAVTLPLTEAMYFVSTGHPLVNLLQTSMNGAMTAVSRNGQSPLSLNNAKVVTWMAGYDRLAKSLFADKGLDCQWIEAANSVNIYVAGAADVLIAMTYNEMIQIRQAGLNPSGEAVYRFRDNGYNIQEEGIYMPRSRYLRDKDRADRFARASRRGWEWVADNQEEALDIVMKYVKKYRIATNRVVQKLMLQEVLHLQLDSSSGLREFRLRPDMVEKANELLFKSGSLKRKVKVEELLP